MSEPVFRRILLLVLDSVGIGAMPDADQYGDAGSDTLGNIARLRPLRLPFLQHLGLANIRPIAHLHPVQSPAAAFGKSTLCSPGKDTTTGHWEMAGIILEKPFPVYPNGFPASLMAEFERSIGRRTLGNKAASGTEIIKELGTEHMRTAWPIVYTSADSVFQVAAHEDVIPVEELYQICETARGLLHGPDEVGRVIARPFTGTPGAWTRTANRHDLAVPPPNGMLLDQLAASQITVTAIGKISDVFLGRGITRSLKTRDNQDGMQKTAAILDEASEGLVFVNLVDFDQLYGHRNDVDGYAQALEAVDTWLPSLHLRASDLVIITADHGCDPTTPSTDHSREYTPLLVYGDYVQPGVNLGIRRSLADIGQTIAANFGTQILRGTSFLHDISKG